MSDDEGVIPKSWLKRRKTVEELESKHTQYGPPFGYLNAEWVQLKTKLVQGDELWEFSSSSESWQALAGRAGIAVVREGRAIDYVITLLN